MENYNNTIVFTDWYQVQINGSDSFEISVPKFLKELEKGLNSKAYNVFFNEDNKKFIITYKGHDYDVIFNRDEEESLLSGQYSPLIIKLLWLTKLEKKYNDERAIQAVREAKIESFENSNYENLETVEDYELYLEFLKNKLNKATSQEEKNAINTKITIILQMINEMKKDENKRQNNQEDLEMHINRFIYSDLKQIEELDDENRISLANEIKGIILDYRKRVEAYNQKKKSGLFLGNPLLPKDILGRLIDVEFKIKTAIKTSKISSYVTDSLSGLEERLNSIINDEPQKRR